MNHKKHKKATILLGGILLGSLFLNLIQTLFRSPRYFVDIFRWTREVDMPWIPYISLAVIFLSAIGAAGLLKYRWWGFYCMYASYLAAAAVVWFPFAPGFIFQFTSGIYATIMTLALVVGILTTLIYLHVSGKKYQYFGNLTTAQNGEL